MKAIYLFGLAVVLGVVSDAGAQSMSTRISRVEIDGKAVKTEYKVFFRHDGKIIDAEETGTGFVMPEKLRGADQLTVIIRLGKYRMEFSGVDSSKFQEDWVVGIDNKPFSSENAYLLGSRRVKRAYYIVFKGGSLETRYVVAAR